MAGTAFRSSRILASATLCAFLVRKATASPIVKISNAAEPRNSRARRPTPRGASSPSARSGPLPPGGRGVSLPGVGSVAVGILGRRRVVLPVLVLVGHPPVERAVQGRAPVRDAAGREIERDVLLAGHLVP